jgi:NAD(P)-dependent dehydrogenase (short-subunit alcohol dehydrogenase family)
MQLSAAHVIDEIRVNALGPMLLSRYLVEPLRRSAKPRIVNVSSTVGSMEVARTIGRDVGYATSKAALNMITVKLANRLATDGIIAVAVHPGLLRTAIATPRGDLEDPAVGAVELVALIDSLTTAQSGCFLRRDGTIHPW